MIYLDSCLLIYAIEDDPLFAPRVRRAIAGRADAQFAISPLVHLECLVKPMRTGDLALRARFESALTRFVQLPLGVESFIQAAELRARFGLRTPDALHLACALDHGCEALWTNDDRLAAAAHGLALDVLK
ncbi:type II toxin-antitoxin system VapC family toxin [Pseudazoarcus pumilus]|uniref:Ribonuclease VapC n=1 Tax=Pseudazoarcus pumilus TaxID=2067960 RepID=A0A2I6S3I3_9RHOO|nr:type II toxin-antitoxin system VapC family toxin [Pseudazoarcus pumilus]AUN93826.1 VapC toxin family PIN domain ribonuclease [Pseudazoarcus pumilus]